MATIFDVADWFLSKEAMTPKKLQKLCYYYKAWGLVLLGDLLPDVNFQAWVHGPVNPELYRKYKDYMWRDIPQTQPPIDKFSPKEETLLNSVWDTYGDMTANALEVQTHIEEPWQRARQGLYEFDNSKRIIKPEYMKRYYGKLYRKSQGE